MKEKYKRQQRKDYMPQKKRGNTSETPLWMNLSKSFKLSVLHFFHLSDRIIIVFTMKINIYHTLTIMSDMHVVLVNILALIFETVGHSLVKYSLLSWIVGVGILSY
jgi:hypothetical protein